jgi:very-short-patch-repair endonuclease
MRNSVTKLHVVEPVQIKNILFTCNPALPKWKRFQLNASNVGRRLKFIRLLLTFNFVPMNAERELEVKQKLASARSRQSQNFMTRPVLTLLSSLIPLLGEPEIEYQIGVYTVDICYPSLYVVIEVDGNYWHNFPFGLARDKRKTQFLEELGWKVFRYWEKDILSDPVAIATVRALSLDEDQR